MTDEEKRALSDIRMDVVYLDAFIEGLTVLIYAADGDRNDPDTRRARNCIAPLSEKLSEHAQKIADDLEAYT